jgi:transglutaminase-like putative cysteine protease
LPYLLITNHVPPAEEACEICGYHCWAEFFAAGLGWVPVDAWCACKYGKEHLFGDREMDQIAWSVGRDLVLEPAQRSCLILFRAGPYAEADDRPYAGIERRISSPRSSDSRTRVELPPGARARL